MKNNNNLHCIKNTYHYDRTEDPLFFIGVFRVLLYKVSYREVLVLSLVALPIICFGQLFYKDSNSVPLIVLENVYSNEDKETVPVLFVSGSTVISTSVGTLLFVNGRIQKDSLVVTLRDVLTSAGSTTQESDYKIKLPIQLPPVKLHRNLKDAVCQSLSPLFPWDKIPFRGKVFCVLGSVVSFTSTCLQKKVDTKYDRLYYSYCDSNLHYSDSKTAAVVVYFDIDTKVVFEGSLTEFSSRPPPVAWNI